MILASDNTAEFIKRWEERRNSLGDPDDWKPTISDRLAIDELVRIVKRAENGMCQLTSLFMKEKQQEKLG